MIKDAGYGIIPYYLHENDYEFLLIQHTSGHWSFPKGHKELNETELEAAERELQEETGISAVEIDTTGRFIEHYIWKNEEKTIDKHVTFFLGRIFKKEVKTQPEEIQNFAWLSFEEAVTRLTYSETQQVFQSAYDYLTTSRQSQF